MTIEQSVQGPTDVFGNVGSNLSSHLSIGLSDTTPGNLALVLMYATDGAPAPGGWTRAFQGSSALGTLGAYWREVEDAETSALLEYTSGQEIGLAFALELSGADTSNPFPDGHVVGNAVASLSLTAGAYTVTPPHSLMLDFLGGRPSDIVAGAPINPVSTLLFNTTEVTQNLNAALAYRLNVNAQEYVPQHWTRRAAGERQDVLRFAIAPAS